MHNFLVITGEDFAELLLFQCSDLPLHLIQQSIFHLKSNEKHQRKAPLATFLSFFRVCFFYNGRFDVERLIAGMHIRPTDVWE